MRNDSSPVDEKNAVRPALQIPRLQLARVLDLVRRAVGGDRFENLYRAIEQEVVSLPTENKRLLDYGCGSMIFSDTLKRRGAVADYFGVDTFPAPTDSPEIKWSNYAQLAEAKLETLGTFDLAVVIDVLHHAAESDRPSILRSLGDICRYVVVKDHFEYGPVSRQKLRLADWYGNYAYGVNIPDRYFTPESWSALVKDSGLKELKRVPGVTVHAGLFGMILPRKHHFISILGLGDKP